MNTNDIYIRKAAATDLKSVYRLIVELEQQTFDPVLFEEIYSGNLNDPDCHYFVAEHHDEVIGFISLQTQRLLHHCGTVGEIQEFCIDGDYRGKGVGRMLMDAVKKYAVAHNIKDLEVTSNKRRVENVSIYESLGFKLTHNKFTL